jgi:hypothetical protein
MRVTAAEPHERAEIAPMSETREEAKVARGVEDWPDVRSVGANDAHEVITLARYIRAMGDPSRTERTMGDLYASFYGPLPATQES